MHIVLLITSANPAKAGCAIQVLFVYYHKMRLCCHPYFKDCQAACYLNLTPNQQDPFMVHFVCSPPSHPNVI